MPITWMCPYFSWEDVYGKKVYCDCARLKFETQDERNDYVKRYCANNPGWQRCTIAQNLTRKFEREDGGD